MGTAFEDSESPVQDLTFRTLSQHPQGGRILRRFSRSMVRPSGQFTIFALLLSDQCPWSTVIVSRHYGPVSILHGPVISQVDGAVSILSGFNQCRTQRGHPPSWRYPVRAISDALMAMTVDRDYTSPLPLVIDVSSDRIEMVSSGGWFRRCEDSDGSPVVPMNPTLSSMFRETGDYPFVGTSALMLVREHYRNSGTKPMFYDLSGQIAIVLPVVVRYAEVSRLHTVGVLRHIWENGGSTIAGIASGTMFGRPTVRRTLCRLEDEGLVFRMGTGLTERFFLCDRRKVSLLIGDIRRFPKRLCFHPSISLIRTERKCYKKFRHS